MERTMLKKFCQAQELHMLASKDQVHPELGGFLDLFSETFQPHLHSTGTLLTDNRSFSDTFRTTPFKEKAPPELLSVDIQQLLLSWHVENSGPMMPEQETSPYGVFHKSLIKRGADYRPDSPLYGLIAFGAGVPDGWSAGCIQHIFTHDHFGSSNTFLVLREFAPLSTSDAQYDHYRQFPHSGGRVYYSNYTPGLVLIHSDEVIAHIVHTEQVSDSISCPHFLAIPMDRVRAAILQSIPG
jgi:hypothetical protein